MSSTNPTTTPAAEGLWTVRDVAAYLKASRSWVYQKAEAGLLPSMRIGGLLRFNPEAVRAWAQGKPAPVLPMRRGRLDNGCRTSDN